MLRLSCSPENVMSVDHQMLLEHQVASLFSAACKQVHASNSALMKTPDDIEALHQFRISLRRVKSLLHSFKDVMRETIYSTLNSNVSGPLSASNALRDHDVLIAALSDDAARHNEPVVEHLHALIRHLKRVRKRIRKHTFQYIDKWQFAECSGAFTRKPVRGESFKTYLHASLTDHQQKIESCLSSVRHSKKDKPVHQLRIACKHYRYLLEMSKQGVTPAIRKAQLKRLKALQSLLGQFNDYAVWRHHLWTLSNAEKISRKASYACGAFSVKCWYMQRQLLPDIRESSSHLFD